GASVAGRPQGASGNLVASGGMGAHSRPVALAMTALLQKYDKGPAAVTVSAALVSSHPARRRPPERSPRRRRSPAGRRPCAPCRDSSRGLRDIALVGGRAGRSRGFCSHLVPAQLFLA